MSMRKFFLFALLVAATSLFAETKVETFTTEDGTETSSWYMTTATTLKCDQASWTVLGGGIRKNAGNMGATNFTALVRAKRSDDPFEGDPYIMSDSIEGGIDSLWFTWNSNGKETGRTWNVKVYVNDNEVGAITEAGAAQIAAGGPFKTFKAGGIGVEGKFVIKIINLYENAGANNYMRLVVDDLGWNTYGAAPTQSHPTFEFAEEALIKMIDAEAFVNELTNGSDATATYESSNPEVATVAEDGTVTIVAEGTTTITASVAETESYYAASASYTLRIVPTTFHMETFDGAENVDLSTNNTYLTTPTASTNPSTATGITWTTLLGSVRNSLGGSAATNMAAVVRAKKNAEENFGYLESSVISGGIDHLAFDWNANGSEASRKKNWDIVIYINGDSIGEIKDKGAAIQPMGSWFRFEVNDLKIDGDFTIKIVNNNVPDDGSGNQYRFVVDNLEWLSYEAPCEPSYGIMVDGTDYVAGVKNEAQTSWLEYTITATLNANQTFVIYDACAQVGFMARQDAYEANYKFNYTDGNAAFLVPQDGKYTIYLKMYGIDDNEIYTVREDIPTGIENQAVKADVRKMIEDGMVVIYRNGVRYNLQGKKF